MIIPRPPLSPPDSEEEHGARAVRYEWWTLAFLASVTVVMYLAMGGSQAMKTAWIEDLLSLVPPILVLVAFRVRDREPDERFPFGLWRAGDLAFLGASVAVVAVGAFLLFDSTSTLLRGERPTLGAMTLLGHTVWAGWVMIAALVYSVIPAALLGRVKLPLARELNDKALHTDAAMNRADWMTGVAGIVGILGVGGGLWWADSAAAGFIALDVIRDGIGNLRRALEDLADESPRTLESHRPLPLIEDAVDALEALPWVRRAGIRLREEGHVYGGVAFVEPIDDADLLARLDEARGVIADLDWRLYAVEVVPRVSLAPFDGEGAGT